MIERDTPADVGAIPSHDAYAALRHRDFRWFIVSLFTMVVGSQAQAVVVGWQVYALTRDPLSLGLIGLAEAMPFIGIALPAGYLADRRNRRAISVAMLFVLALCSAALVALSATPGLLARVGVVPVYAIIFVTGVARGILQPARQALGADIIPRTMYRNAIAWRSSTWQTASVLGPALGGLLYGFAGAVAAYGVAALLTLVALGAFLMVRYTPEPRSLTGTSMFEELLSGLRFVKSEHAILAALSLDLFSVFLGGAEALLPVFASEILHVGPQGLGLLRAAPAAGAVTMGIFIAHRPPFRRAGRTMLLAVAVFALAIIGFGLSRNFYLSLALLALSGMADNVSVVIRSTLIQLLTPPQMLGRVSAVNSIFIGSSNELGAFESGVAARLLGAVPAVVLGGTAALAVVGLTARLVPRLRTLGRIG
ncbi:MAG TPA: MFS transporter [Gemmatimonadaceae bacterium]|nr:MFS transporter [Gemmatimonadaceae bacterium]